MLLTHFLPVEHPMRTCLPLCMTFSQVPGGRNPTDTSRLLRVLSALTSMAM